MEPTGSQPRGEWSRQQVGGHPCDVFEPAVAMPDAVVLYLHDLHQHRLEDVPAFAAEFTRPGLRIVAPCGARSWWTDRICAEFDPNISAERHVLNNVVPWIAERWGVRPPGVALLGTDMGGQGALRLAFRHPDTFPIVAAISPAIDFQLRFEEEDETLPQMYADEEAARQDTATLHVHPLNWPRNLWFCCDPADDQWHPGAERLRTKLAALGIPHECDLATSGGGHGFEFYTRMAPAAARFILDRLARERLRVR